MSYKKIVSLLVFLIVILMMSGITLVSAACDTNNPYNLNIGVVSGGDVATGSGDFTNSFKTKFTFSDCSSGQLTQSMSLSGGKDQSFSFGGFLYTSTPLTSVNVHLRKFTSCIYSDRSQGAKVAMSIYDLNSLSFSSQQGLFSISDLTSTLSDSIRKYYDSDWIHNSGDSEKTIDQDLSTPLEPGMYFLAGLAGIWCHKQCKFLECGGGNGCQWVTYSTGMTTKPIRFNSMNDWDTDSSLIHPEHYWIISYRPLTKTEINDNFGIRVELVEGLCTAADGYFEPNILDSGNGNIACCGNKDTDVSSNYYIGNNGIIYTCTTSGWEEHSKEEVCKATIEPDPYEEDDVYLSSFNSLNTQTFMSFTNGSDGCCGDDTNVCELKINPPTCNDLSEHTCVSVPGCVDSLDGYCEGTILPSACSSLSEEDCTPSYCEWAGSDFGSVVSSSGSSFFCGKDFFDDSDYGTRPYHVDEDVSSWSWWDAELPDNVYQIHSLGLNTDYVSNGATWNYCNASSSGGSSVPFLETFPLGMFDATSYCSNFPSDLRSNGGWYNYAFATSEVCGQILASDNTEAELLTLYNAYVSSDADVVLADFVGCCHDRTNDFFVKDVSNYFDNGAHSDSCERLICSYDAQSGPPNPDVIPDGDDNFANKDDIHNDNSGDYPSADSCAELASTIYLPVDKCEDDELVCFGGDNYTTNFETSCCVNGVCRKQESLSCGERGGQIASSSSIDLYVCLGGIFVSTPDAMNLNCCLGTVGVNTDISSFTSRYDDNESFICYDGPNGRPMFAECCGSTNCHNMYTWNYLDSNGDLGKNNGRIFTKGSQLHTLKSFDTVINNYFVDRYLTTTAYETGGEIVTAPQSFYIGDTPLNNPGYEQSWDNGYESLTFDVRYYGPYDLKSLILTRPNGSFEIVDLENYTLMLPIKGYDEEGNEVSSIIPRFVWHRVTIPLDDELLSKTTDNDYFKSSHFLFSSTPRDGFGEEGKLEMDNMVLVRNGDVGGSVNQYCAGEFRKWLPDLEPTDINEDGIISFEESAPEMVACNAQPSFSWTGEHCCGYTSNRLSSVTSYQNSFTTATDYNTGEYFTDALSACWGGISLLDNQIVPQVYGGNLDAWPYILYKSNQTGAHKFWSCETPITLINNQGVTYTTEEITEGQVQINKVPLFSIVGDWYCAQGEEENDPNRWLSLEQLKSTPVKILATKMYGMVEGNSEDFTLHCDDFELIKPVNSSSLNAIPVIGDMPNTACVLKNNSGADSSVIIGIPLAFATYDTTEKVNELVKTLYASYYPVKTAVDLAIENNDEHPTPDCNFRKLDGSEINDFVLDSINDFFSECSGSSNTQGLRVYYNKPLNLLLVSMHETVKQGFIAKIWESIMAFFKGLFKPELTPIDQVSSQTEIPLSLRYQADFTHLYIAKKGEMIVKGVMEQNKDTHQWYVRADYIKFKTSVEPLVKGYRSIGIGPNQALYCTQTTGTQSIFINYGSKYEQTFDWRYLTSNLRLKEQTGNQVTFTSDENCWLHNGEIDNTNEECDDTPEQQYEIVALADPNAIGCECVNGKLNNACEENVDYYILYVTEEVIRGDQGYDAITICQGEAATLNQRLTNDSDSIDYTAPRTLMAPSAAKPLLTRQFNFNGFANEFQNLNVKAAGKIGNEGDIGIINEIFNNFASNKNFLFKPNGEVFTNEHFWTGSSNTGTYSNNNTCEDWTALQDKTEKNLNARIGGASVTVAGDWIAVGTSQCSNQQHIACIVPITKK